MAALASCARPRRRYTLRFMPPPRPPFVFPLWSFAGPSRFARPGGRELTFSDMLTELLVGYGLVKRRPSLRDQTIEQQKVERVAEEFEAEEAKAKIEAFKAAESKGKRMWSGRGSNRGRDFWWSLRGVL